MPFAGRPGKQGGGGHGGDELETLSSNLWVGNLPSEVSESELMELFAKHGAMEDLTSYSSRNYAFVYYKHAESAKAARAALQGYVIRGNPIKIEFAKPAKPSKNLWVGGISSSVTKEHLEGELLRFGKIQELKFVKDRNIALVEYARLEDASAALKSLNGKQIGGGSLRVDYLRSQPARREQFDFHDPRDQQFRRMGGPEQSWTFRPESTYSGPKRQQLSQPLIGRKDGQPSRVLWVGYPPSVIIDEKMLYNAMILFGEIELIKCFPSRHYSFVEFRSVEEARNAKENLQGKLFNDPRITIMFSSSDMAPKDFLASYSGLQGPRPEMLMNDSPLRPPAVDVIGHSPVIGPNNFSGGPPNGALGPGVFRPFGPRGGFDALLPTAEFNDPSMIHDTNDFGSPVGSNRRRLSSPTTGLLPPLVANRPPNKASGWDVLDASQIPRELKRARTDACTSFIDSPFNVKGDDIAPGVGRYVTGPQHEGSQLLKARGGDRFSPADVTGPDGPLKIHAVKDYIWRGVIAKGGSTVCHARCILVDKEIDFHIPEVVDCSARTGLDMLAKHYAEAVGFDIVFFLPDSEEDFASYTEFLCYLGSKSRAGVARFDDGTTMFLVPPSEFLTKVLKVVGPERLYGVVLKLARQASADVPAEQQVNQPISSMHHMDQPPVPLPYDYNVSSQREQAPHMDHNKFAYEGSLLHAKTEFPPTSEPPMAQVAPHDPTNASVSGAGVALSPELIATLASLLPANTHTSVGQSPQVPVTSSTLNVSNPSLGFDKVTSSQSWNQQHQVPDQMAQSSQQSGNQINSLPHSVSSYQNYPSISSISIQPAQVLPETVQFQNPAYSFPHNLPQHGAVSSKPLGIFPDASHSHQYALTTQATQPFQQEVPYNAQTGYGMGVAATGSYGLPDGQTPQNPIAFPNQIQGSNFPHSENVVAGTNNGLSDSLNHIEHHQPVSATAGQSTVDVEVDKNQRYQSTLQFAANLLLQIQQKQQANSQVRQGLGDQQ